MTEDVSDNESSEDIDQAPDDPGDAPASDEASGSPEDTADTEKATRQSQEDAGSPAATPRDRPEHLADENFFTTTWRGHEIAVSGDWTLRWLFLTPTYSLWIDGQKVESVSGPRVNPSLDAILEDETGEAYHLSATLTSIVGFRPPCKISIEEEVIARGDLRVANFMNPFLVLFILIATGVMLYVGPEVIGRYLP